MKEVKPPALKAGERPPATLPLSSPLIYKKEGETPALGYNDSTETECKSDRSYGSRGKSCRNNTYTYIRTPTYDKIEQTMNSFAYSMR